MNKFTLTLSAICFLFYADHSYGQWIQTSLSGVSVFALVVSGDNTFAGTEGRGVFLSTNSGVSWTAVNSGLTDTTILSLAVSGGNIFAGTEAGGVFLSTNNGTSWTAADSGLPFNSIRKIFPFINAFAVSGGTLITGTGGNPIPTGGGVFLSTNNGTSWTAVNSGLRGVVLSFAVSGSNIFAGTTYDYGDRVFLSTNNGTSWTEVTSNLPTYANNAVSLAVSGSNIFAAIGYFGVFLSTNNGKSWNAVNSGLMGANKYCLAVSASNIFVGTSGYGVFLSINNGTSWDAVNASLTNKYVYCFTVSGDYIYAGTGGSGVWRRPLSEMVSVLPQTQQSSPLQTRLRIGGSGFPHSGTMLTYNLQSRCFVQLAIYTISGKRVAVIDQGERTPGEYIVKFDGGAIPSGLYVCRLQAGNYQESNRFVAVK